MNPGAAAQRPRLVLLRDNGRNRFSLHRLMVLLEYLPGRVHWSVVSSPGDLDAALSLRPDAVVCWSFMTAAASETLHEIRAVRAAYPRARLLAGGPHPSACPDEILGAGIDTVFVGEAEGTFPSYWERFVAGGDPAPPRIVHPDRLLPLDEIPPFASRAAWFAPVEITRGCRFSCKFCQIGELFPRAIRHRTVDALRAWYPRMLALDKPKWIAMSPSALSFQAKRPGEPNLEAVEQLLASVREAGFTQVVLGDFPSEIRPEDATPEAVRLLARLCTNRTIALGAEAATDGLLRASSRGHDVAAVDEAVHNLHEAGFTPQVDYIFGMPGETAADRAAMIGQIERLMAVTRARFLLHHFLPLPGTAWAGQSPAPLDEPFLDAMRRLGRTGRAGGDWIKQMQDAPELAKRYRSAAS